MDKWEIGSLQPESRLLQEPNHADTLISHLFLFFYFYGDIIIDVPDTLPLPPSEQTLTFLASGSHTFNIQNSEK